MSTRTAIEDNVIEEIEVFEPKKYKVIMHNDDITTYQCVIEILTGIFHKTMDEAASVTEMVHLTGSGIAGVYSKEVAEEKVDEATRYARSGGFPLKLTAEEY